jgi:hypothetical protein
MCDGSSLLPLTTLRLREIHNGKGPRSRAIQVALLVNGSGGTIVGFFAASSETARRRNNV